MKKQNYIRFSYAFQFLIGRLAIPPFRFFPRLLKEFQFLIGRLAINYFTIAYHSIIARFQFLIGRLAMD